MSYLRAQTGRSGAALGATEPYAHCSCKGGFGPQAVGGAFEDAVAGIKDARARELAEAWGVYGLVSQIEDAKAAGSSSSAIRLPSGATTTLGASYPADPAAVRELQRQVNRFVGHGILVRPLAVDGVLAIATAMPATMVLLMRLGDAQATYGSGVSGLLRQAGENIVNPVPFVGKNLAEVTATVAAYANVKGLPPPGGGHKTLLIAGGLAVAALLFLKA